MDFDVLRALVVVAREGNMTRAASKLYMTQPALSAQIKRLEQELGQVLFVRHPRGMSLSEAGEVFIVHAQQALSSVERGKEALASLKDLGGGSLAIGGGATATTYLLPPVLGRFHQAYPGVRLFVRELSSRQVLEGVFTGDLDLGVVTLDPGEPLARHLRGKLLVEPWVEDELVLLVPPEHPLRGQSTFAWELLDAEPFVFFEAHSAVRSLIDAHFRAAQVVPEVVMELRSIESIKKMVAQGIGAAFVSRAALGPFDQGLVCAVEDGRVRRTLALVQREGQTPRRAAQVFVELLRA